MPRFVEGGDVEVTLTTRADIGVYGWVVTDCVRRADDHVDLHACHNGVHVSVTIDAGEEADVTVGAWNTSGMTGKPLFAVFG